MNEILQKPGDLLRVGACDIAQDLVLKPSGRLRVYDSTDKHNPILLSDRTNMITIGYTQISTHLLPGVNVDDYRIYKFKLSVGTKDPTKEDTDLEVPQLGPEYAFEKLSPSTGMVENKDYIYNSTIVNTPYFDIVEFVWIIEPNEANNDTQKIYTEAGMFTKNDVMFCRNVFAPIVKVPSRRLTFNWQITYK